MVAVVVGSVVKFDRGGLDAVSLTKFCVRGLCVHPRQASATTSDILTWDVPSPKLHHPVVKRRRIHHQLVEYLGARWSSGAHKMLIHSFSHLALRAEQTIPCTCIRFLQTCLCRKKYWVHNNKHLHKFSSSVYNGCFSTIALCMRQPLCRQSLVCSNTTWAVLTPVMIMHIKDLFALINRLPATIYSGCYYGSNGKTRAGHYKRSRGTT